MTDRKQRLAALADRVARGTGEDNHLDVEVEVAMFEPCKAWAAIRPNAAGTKVIYTTHDGRDMTNWAPDHTKRRSLTAIDLLFQSETVA